MQPCRCNCVFNFWCILFYNSLIKAEVVTLITF
nr:MAG TPA: hypothetical protein [Caudoviricetes sp.]